MSPSPRFVKGIAAALFLVLAVRRFIPAIPLALVPHQGAPLPDPGPDPEQERITEAAPIERPDGIPVRLIPRATFRASGEVVSAEHYRFDDGAFAIPYDIAIRWGVLLDEPYLSRVSYYQNGRFCLWRTNDNGLDPRVITAHMANIHVIPAGPGVRRALAHVRRRNLVRLEGELVDLEGLDRREGYRWGTSLSRTDSDKGACETIYLRALTVGTSRYE